jgi:hypothetical protein
MDLVTDYARLSIDASEEFTAEKFQQKEYVRELIRNEINSLTARADRLSSLYPELNKRVEELESWQPLFHRALSAIYKVRRYTLVRFLLRKDLVKELDDIFHERCMKRKL